jgi:hypothetical protein
LGRRSGGPPPRLVSSPAISVTCCSFGRGPASVLIHTLLRLGGRKLVSAALPPTRKASRNRHPYAEPKVRIHLPPAVSQQTSNSPEMMLHPASLPGRSVRYALADLVLLVPKPPTMLATLVVLAPARGDRGRPTSALKAFFDRVCGVGYIFIGQIRGLSNAWEEGRGVATTPTYRPQGAGNGRRQAALRAPAYLTVLQPQSR